MVNSAMYRQRNGYLRNVSTTKWLTPQCIDNKMANSAMYRQQNG